MDNVSLLRSLYIQFYEGAFELKEALNQLDNIGFVFADDKVAFKIEYHIVNNYVSVSASGNVERLDMWTTTSESNFVSLISNHKFNAAYTCFGSMDTIMFETSLLEILKLKFVSYYISEKGVRIK